MWAEIADEKKDLRKGLFSDLVPRERLEISINYLILGGVIPL
jgi:hypothetical protein